jgi:hypothetical protein
MLVAVLWFGLLWPQIAPMTIVPGMSRTQVEAILGEQADLAYVAAHGAGGPCFYRNSNLTVLYNGNKVVLAYR